MNYRNGKAEPQQLGQVKTPTPRRFSPMIADNHPERINE